MIMRNITSLDFDGREYIKAQYLGNLKTDYLEYGKWYNVVFKESRNKVAIPIGLNPTAKPNCGYEVSLKNFYVEDK